MSGAGELVAVTDPDGKVIGAEPRWRVRRDNLWHQATGVIVRNPLGLVYVHRRTATKDVYPSRHDCCAGGVVTAGETPDEAARRELAEELGITGVPLVPVLRGSYADDVVRHHAYVFEVTWDGPVRHQLEEVAWGGWMELAELADRLADPTWPFVPDTRALIGDWLGDRLADRRPIAGGWDSATTLVEGRWIDRVPRRPEVAERLRTETRLLPWLAPRLPLAVPVPAVIVEEPLRVRHVALHGSPLTAPTAVAGAAAGRFLPALHATPVDEAVTRGVPHAARASAALAETLERLRSQVLPLVPTVRRAAATRLLEAVRSTPATTLIHADLGPDHLLGDGRDVTGVIDWSDAVIGDPALDLSWGLHGSSPEFAAALAAAYRPDADLVARSRLWHQLGPWHEVAYGLDTDQPEFVSSGLAGVLARLGR